MTDFRLFPLNKILLVLVLMCGCATSRAQVNAEQVLNIGRNVLSMEDYMLSIQYFNQAIKAKPYLSDPYFFRALAKLNLEDYKGAEDDCTLALERNKFKTECYKLRGFARQNLGKDSLAVEDYEVGLLYNPQDKYFLYYKGVAQTELKRIAEAGKTFESLLKLYPQFDEGFVARARLNLVAGDTVKGIDDLNRAIELSKAQINPYLLRAHVRSQRKEWSGAAEDMDEAIRLAPQDADLYLNRAYIRYNLDDWFGAMADYNYTLELQPYNSAAIFNRALLRYEVRDLNRAAEDFAEVLKYEPDNFHAQYNLGLVNLDRKKPKEALKSFDKIAAKYPKFYPVYYAKAEAYRDMGDMRAAIMTAHAGEELVKRYVKNPERNPLDRPRIAAGKTRDGKKDSAEENPDDVMDRFNQLVTVGAESQQQLTYNEKIKGKVQDRDMNVELEPDYILSFVEDPESLNFGAGYVKEIEEFNSRRYLNDKIYLSSASNKLGEEAAAALFARADYYESAVKGGNARTADLLALGVVRTVLKDYQAAQRALDAVVERDPEFALAYLLRGYVRSVTNYEAGAMTDYDRAVELNPNLFTAWFSKGNILSNSGDYTSAVQCYSEALKLNPNLGRAYYNRGLAYLRMGNRRLAFADLSKAGELGVLPSYNILKRMK